MRGRRLEKQTTVGARSGPRGVFWLVIAVTVLTFLPTLTNEFVNWDDDVNFLENPYYRGLGVEQLAWGASTFLLGHYHPLTWFTLSLDYAVWGLDPFGYHLTNLLLHGLTAGLVFLLFREWLGLALERAPATTVWAAAFGALLFAVHPLRVESVAWASERRDVLSGVFVVATLLMYSRRRTGWALVAFCAALMSKVIAVTLPVVLLLIDWYPLRRRVSMRLLLEKWPFVVASAMAAWIALGRYESGVLGSVADLGLYPSLRVAFSLFGPAFYVFKTLVPWNLAPQYVWATAPSAFDPLLVVGGGFVLVLSAAAWGWRRRLPGFSTAWAAMIVTLLPVLSIVRLDRQQFVADHHSYMATLGLAAVLAGGWSGLHERGRRAASAGAVVVVLVLAGLTVRQIGFWRDSETLWSHTLEVSPLSVTAHNNLGRAVAARGDSAGAVAHFRRATELEPRFAQAHYNLGSVLMGSGELESALGSLLKAVEVQPKSAQIRSDLGNCYLRLQRTSDALREYEEALELDPAFSDARFNYALALELSGRREAALVNYELVTRSQPSNRDAWLALERLRTSGADKD